MKSHLQGIKTVLYCYLLAICISWVSYPVLIFLTFIIDLQVSQSIYTIFSTLVFCAILYILMHEVGFKDRKPVNEIRYSTKGFVCGAIAFTMIILVEALIIFLADRYILVKHPFLVISNINAYLRLILYMPFYWLYKLLDPSFGVVPKVSYLTSLLPGIIVIPISGFGYYMGFNSKKLINKDFTGLKNKFFYKGDKE